MPLPVILKSPLPPTLDIPGTASTSSTVQGGKYWRPDNVECWLHVRPEDETSPLLLDAITEFQDAPPFPPAFTHAKYVVHLRVAAVGNCMVLAWVLGQCFAGCANLCRVLARLASCTVC